MWIVWSTGPQTYEDIHDHGIEERIQNGFLWQEVDFGNSRNKHDLDVNWRNSEEAVRQEEQVRPNLRTSYIIWKVTLFICFVFSRSLKLKLVT